jgi:hypothetical protein
MKRTSTPTIDKIVKYWIDNGDDVKGNECFMGADISDWSTHCWRCGHDDEKLEKCHIVPHSLGGSSNSSNLVLLCNRCHNEAPNVNCEFEMWYWIKRTKAVYYNTYWTWIESTNEAIELCSVHFGQGLLNESTKKWVLNKACEIFKSKKIGYNKITNETLLTTYPVNYHS